jgi:hypothetical protein
MASFKLDLPPPPSLAAAATAPFASNEAEERPPPDGDVAAACMILSTTFASEGVLKKCGRPPVDSISSGRFLVQSNTGPVERKLPTPEIPDAPARENPDFF